ncbi:MAG TPA: OB-fold domain-containing protein [Dehalococcoidia bacterium]|nr:OB-fold domain-containing protein [Dehalococcoidia bacterium]
MADPSRAVPAVTDLTQRFWDAAKAGRLAIQRCQSCRYYNHPPKALCDRCQSPDLAFEEVSGNGSVWSFTVMHQKSVAGFEESVPYVTALVQLDEQPMLLLVTNLPGVSEDSILIGARVHVTFEMLNDEIALPQFESVR